MSDAKVNSSPVQEIIIHCQKQIKKNTGEEKLLHYIGRLRRLRIKVKDLVDTGIGRTVNQLSRLEGKVGHEALDLVADWKALVEAEEKEKSSSEESSSHEEEEEEDEPDDDQDDVGGLRIIDQPEVDDADADAEVETNNHENESNLPRLTHSRSRSPPLVSSHSNCMSEESGDDEYENRRGHSSGEDENRVVPHVKSEPSSPGRIRNISPTMKRHNHPNGDLVNEVEQRSHHRNNDRKHERIDTEKHKSKSHSSHSHKPSHRKHASSSAGSDSSDSSMSEAEDVDRSPVKIKVEKSEIKSRHSHGSSHGHSHRSSHEDKKKDRHRHVSNNHQKHNGIDKDRHKKDKEHHKKHRDTERDSGFEVSQEVLASIKPEPCSSDEEMVSPARSGSRNGTSSSFDPSIRVKAEDNRKSENQKNRDKSKHKERKTEESRSSSKTKDDKTRRHSRGDSSAKHRHKNDDSSSSKRKNDEELVKPETNVKKVKLESKPEKQKNPRQLLPTLSVEIDSTSGVNFADVLSCMDQKVSSSSSKKKDKPKTNGNSSSPKSSAKASGSDPSVSSKSKRTAHEDKRNVNKNGVSSKEKEKDKRSMKPKSVILPTYSLTAAALISPNYKPSAVARIMAVAPMPVPKATTSVPPREILNSLRQDYGGSAYPAHEGENRLDYDRRTTEDALSTMIASRNQRTKVYSGVKSGVVGAMPKLFDLCIRVIQENINDLGYTGGVPYDILKPVLDRATVDQLIHVENYNPYLIEYTDEMWKFHCGKDFRGQVPQELESWREMYTRLVDERKARFHTLTNKVKRTQETATPQMKAKLAYVDTTSGPRFHKSKAETIKNGMKTLKTREEKGIKRTHGSSASAGGSGSSQNVTIEEASVIISAKSRAGSAPASSSREPRESTAAKKPKKAPLMQKTLKVIKTLFRR